jgi:hypothetical protein
MTILNHDTRWLPVEKELAWLFTLALMVAGLPLLKNAIVFILENLYELFIQQATGN